MLSPPRRQFYIDSVTQQLNRKRKPFNIYQRDQGILKQMLKHQSRIRIFHPKAFVSVPKKYKSLQAKPSKQYVKKINTHRQKYISHIFSQGRTQPLCLKLPSILKNINTIQPIVSQKCLFFMSELSSISPHQIKSGKKKKQIVITQHQEPQSQQQIKIMKNKQYRKNKLLRSKKLLNQQQLFTKEGWKHQTRGHWLAMFSSNK